MAVDDTQPNDKPSLGLSQFARLLDTMVAREMLREMISPTLMERLLAGPRPDPTAKFAIPLPAPRDEPTAEKERPELATNGQMTAVERAALALDQREADARNHVVPKSKQIERQEVADIVRKGKQIILPEGMSYEEGILTLDRRLQHEGQEIAFSAVISAFPYDGAYALHQVLMARYGWTETQARHTFFGDDPPKLVSVETGTNTRIDVPWGDVHIPGIDGVLSMGVGMKNDQICFRLSATIKRRHQSELDQIVSEVKTYLQQHSIYLGKALKVSFAGPEGRREIPEITFLDVSSASLDNLVFNQFVERQVRTSLLAPLEKRHLLPALGIPFKRGVLLAGSYGVGKTELAHAAAKTANEHGIAFIMCGDPSWFSETVSFAKQYAPAVVFCEDIDRVTSGDRNRALDQILNTVDGIEAKSTDVMIVLTTNEVEEIHEAMIRPGRIDAVIVIEKPNAESVVRLLRLYGRGLIGPNEDLDEIGAMLDGQIPAVIREVVEGSKLGALARGSTPDDMVLIADDLRLQAEAMTVQLALLEKQPEPSTIEDSLSEIGQAFRRDW